MLSKAHANPFISTNFLTNMTTLAREYEFQKNIGIKALVLIEAELLEHPNFPETSSDSVPTRNYSQDQGREESICLKSVT